MRNKSLSCDHARRVVAACVVSVAALLVFSQGAFGASWNGIEPLKSKRADVERILGQPITNQPGENATLHFKVMGGIATVVFVDARFVAAKRLSTNLEGTVRQRIERTEGQGVAVDGEDQRLPIGDRDDRRV